MFRLRDYQEKHTSELRQKIDHFLTLDSNKICVFKSPTGSGKTIMMAELIKRLVGRQTRREGDRIHMDRSAQVARPEQGQARKIL